MRLRVRDMEAAKEENEEDPLNLLDISIDIGDEEDYPLLQWIRHVHMDDRDRNPDPQIRSHAEEYGINVDKVMSEEVGVECPTDFSISPPPGFDYRPRIDGSSTHQSFNDDDDDDDDDGGNEGRTTTTGSQGGGGQSGSEDARRHGFHYEDDQRSFSPFTCEASFTHATQDEDHGSRRAGHGAKTKRGRKSMRDMTDDLSSMSITTDPSQSRDGSLMESTSSDHPSTRNWVNEFEASVSSDVYPYYPLLTQAFQEYQPAPVQVDYRQFPQIGYLARVNQETYLFHVQNYLRGYQSCMSWTEYCLRIPGTDGSESSATYGSGNYDGGHFEPPRNSMWI